MPTPEFTTIDAMLSDLDEHTNALATDLQGDATTVTSEAARLQAIFDQLRASSGMTGAELTAIADKGTAIVGKISGATTGINAAIATLQATGVDASNPTP